MAKTPVLRFLQEHLTFFCVGLRFYSRLPVPHLSWETTPHQPPDFSMIPRVLPFIGLVIGVVGGAVLALALWVGLPPLMASTLAIATLTFITGAFHEDGLADSADGLWGGWTVERRLDIMRDSRIGSYGASALILSFALRITALSEVVTMVHFCNTFYHLGTICALIVTCICSRVAGIAPLVFLKPARSDGNSSQVGRPSIKTFFISSVICVVLSIILLTAAELSIIHFIIAILLVSLSVFYMIHLSNRKLEGQTGDILGATQQVAEISILIAFCVPL